MQFPWTPPICSKIYLRSPVWFAALYMVLCGVVLLVPAPLDGQYGAIGRTVWDCGHVFLGGGLAVALWITPFGATRSARSRALSILLVITALAAVFEVLQMGVGRSSSLKDVISTLAGALLWIGWTNKLQLSTRNQTMGLTALLVAILAVPLVPLMWACYVSIDAWHRLPSLADFRTPGYQGQWESRGMSRQPSLQFPGRDALSITIPPRKQIDPDALSYEIVRFNEFPADWSDFASLEITLSAETPVRISFSLQDRYYRALKDYKPEERFGQMMQLTPGLNTFRFGSKKWRETPGGRQMDETQIALMIFVVRRTEVEQRFTVERIRLYP